MAGGPLQEGYRLEKGCCTHLGRPQHSGADSNGGISVHCCPQILVPEAYDRQMSTELSKIVFGVSGAIEPEVAKRSTIVDTPDWMAPRLETGWVKDLNHRWSVSLVPLAKPNSEHATEVDGSTYDCTI
jgi:hypothetical protein